MIKRACRLLLISLAILLQSISLFGQTLKADYQFQGNLNSSVGTVPALTNLVGSGNGPNAFVTDTVDGFSRQVVNFPLNNGVSINDMTAIVPNTSSLTVVVLFKLGALGGRRRFFDTSGGTLADQGGFLVDGRIEGESTANPSANANAYLQIVMVRGTGGVISGYRDGVLRVSDVDSGQPLTAGLRFFQDYVNSPVQASGGSIARLRVYDGPLTVEQIHQLDRVPETPTGTMPIMFYSNRNGVTEMYRMNADGTSQNRLTNNEVLDFVARFSPNGQKIVYWRRETPNDPYQIWIANSDGSNQTRLTNTTTVDKNPSWRPDGQKILFSRCNPTTLSCDLYTMNPDGTAQAPISAANTVGDEDQARFTPNGAKLVFPCSDANQTNYQICVTNADGTNRQTITNTTAPVVSVQLDISPDSSKIVCIRGTNPGDNRITTMNIDGSNVVTLPQTNNPILPLWSPDGTKIMYSSTAFGTTNEIYIANADGSSPVRITFNGASDIATDWYRPQTVTRRSPFDFDGDAKTDLSVIRPNGPNGAEWWWSRSSNGGNGAVQFGSATDTVAAADYTGDGKTDVAFWRPSTGYWYVLRSEDQTFYALPFGATGDVPVPADYDADGKADTAVFRPSNSTWYINRSSGGTTIQQFGLTTDKPVAADYDGDGKADIAVYRPTGASGSEWWIQKSTGGSFATQFGASTDKAVPADYTGDGKADVAYWRPSTGQWFVLRSEDLTYYGFPFGGNGDLPVPGDYDGDGKSDAAVFRPSESTWYAQRSTAGILIQQFGTTGDLPIPNAYVR